MTFEPPTSLPTGDREWESLIDDLVSVDDIAEDHWLEMKSEVSLDGKAGVAKVAKFILGAANRMPEMADTALGGYSIMVLGISEGSKAGIPRIENHALDRVLKPFFGHTAPKWDYRRIDTMTNNQILVVVVDPPSEGDPIFLCRKTSDDLVDGYTYVRDRGATRPATSVELDQLQERARAGGPVVDFRVRITGSVRAYTCDSTVLDEFLKNEEFGLLATLPKPAPKAPYNFTGIMAAELSKTAGYSMGGHVISEKRNEADFRTEVSTYLEGCRAALSDLRDGVLSRFGKPSTIVVENGPSAFLRNVEIEVHLSGPVDTLETEGGDGDFYPLSYLPDAPNEFGDRTIPLSAMLGANIRPFIPSPMNFTPRASGPTATWRNSGSVTVDLDSFDIRPEATLEFPQDAMLVLRDPSIHTIQCTWKATADGFHQAFRGKFIIKVDEPLDITNLVRSQLDKLGEAADT